MNPTTLQIIGTLLFAIAVLLLFLAFARAWPRFQDHLILRESLMVSCFLAGLVTLGGQQEWWLQPLLSSMSPTAAYYGATALTAVTDNAALTYLGSLVQDLSDEFKVALVTGAVTGGGLTTILWEVSNEILRLAEAFEKEGKAKS